jgi:response regulator NasT
MKRLLSIGVAEDEPDMQEFYEVVIPEMGHELLWVARDGVEMIKKCEEACPDLLIADIKMPRLDGIDAVRSVTSRTPIPVILVTGYHDDETVGRAEVAQVISYLVKPIREADLRTALRIAVQQHEKLETLRDEQHRETINLAAHTLAGMSGMSEQQAFRRLEQLASQEQRSVSEVAETILGAAAVSEDDSED